MDRRAIRQRVLDRDGAICVYCEEALEEDSVSLDHILPESQGGEFSSSNLTIACKPCNFLRGNIPFADFIQQFNFPKSKIEKYLRLSQSNLRIKVLNQAKQHLRNSFEIPEKAIEKACIALAIPLIDFDGLLPFPITEFQKRETIIVAFEDLIRTIERSL